MGTKEYHREYNLRRYYKLIEKAHSFLGGKCSKCGSTDRLEIDHVNPSEKSFIVASKILSFPWSVIEEEIKKCQLLCKSCHNSKTMNDFGLVETKGLDIHGTLSSYRYCHCEICKASKNEYVKNYRKTHPRKKKTASNDASLAQTDRAPTL